MKKAVKGFAGVAVGTVGVLGLSKLISWIESPESTESLLVLLKVLLVIVVLGLLALLFKRYLVLKGTRVVVQHVRQLCEDGEHYLYTVTFNKLGVVVGYVWEDVPGYFGTEDGLKARTQSYSVSLKEARRIARRA